MIPIRPLLIGAAGVALVAAWLAANGREGLAMSALVGVGPFAMSAWLRFRDPRLTNWRALGIAAPIVWASLVVVLAGYWLVDTERRLSGSQAVGLTAAGVASMGMCYVGGVAGHSLARWRRSQRQGADPMLLAGRYRLERVVGHGGMATVSLAHDTVLDRHVAIKIVRDELVHIPGALARFQHEARAAAAFNHANVVTVFDYGVSGTQAFLVMELLHGRTLRALLRAESPVAPGGALRVLRDVAAALDAAHRQGLIHRDLKPENIFLVHDGSGDRAKVLDFGLAQLAAGAESEAPAGSALEGSLIGTPLYMAPEQLRGEAPASSWDIWALSVIAFELLCGTHPFGGVSLQLSTGTDAASTTDTLPGPALACLTVALSIDRAARPTSARQFVDDLERSLHD